MILMLYSFSNVWVQDVQVAAARFLSLLCAISPRVKQYSSENTFNVLEDAQVLTSIFVRIYLYEFISRSSFLCHIPSVFSLRI